MYSNFVAIIHRVLGTGAGRHLVWVFALLAVVSFVMMCLPAWRKREKAAWHGEGRLPLLTLFLAAVFRLTVVTSVVGALAAALLVQLGLFSEKHGQVTERNYYAVKTKWGVPHEQRDLIVRHFIMRKKVEEELANDSTRERWLDERQPAGDEDRVIVSEETFAAPPVKENETPDPHFVTRRTVAWVRQELQEDSIKTSEAEIGIRSNPRRLGNATYAGYEDTWLLKYGVRNTADCETTAEFGFPLPGEGMGVFDRLSVKVDGQDWLANVRYADGRLEWRMRMAPGKECAVEVGYESRGLEYFRYKPGNMRSRCLVTVNVEGIDARRLNFPIGAMPPKDDLRTLSGEKYALHWDLSYAVSNLDIGLIVPAEEQPGYHITKLLGAAPVSLALLAVMLLLTRWLIGERLDILPICLVLVAFYTGVALLANLNDVVSSFPAAFALAVIPVTVGVGVFWCKFDGGAFLADQSIVLYVLFAVLYPIASLGEETSGTALHVFYAALVLYILGLVAWRATRTA